MPIMTFNSREPHLSDLQREHSRIGAHADALLFHPALHNTADPLHTRVVGELNDTFEHIFGTAPVESSQPFDVMTFQTGPARQPIQPVTVLTVLTNLAGTGQPGEPTT